MGAANSTTTVNLGGLMLTNGRTGESGGAVRQSYGTLRMTNVTISGNTAPSYGGGVYQYYGTSTLTNVTISGNAASYGGGLYLYQYSGSLTLKNTIVARNAAGTAPDLYRSAGGGTVAGANSLIGDGTGQASLVNGVGGNLVGTAASPLDPQFVSMTGTDWTQWDLRLRSDSLAVNSGNNAWISPGITTDIAGGPRIVGGTVDMGSYEFNAAPTDAAPGNLVAKAFSPDQINLTWTDDYSSEIGFRIERATDSGFTQNLFSATVPADANSYAATGLSLNTTYYFRVAAMTAQGDTPFSPAVQAILRLGDATLDGQVDLTDLTVHAGNCNEPVSASSPPPAVPQAPAADVPTSSPVAEITATADDQAPVIHLGEVLAPPVSLIGLAAPDTVSDDKISRPDYVRSATLTYTDDAAYIIYCFSEDERIAPTAIDTPIFRADDDKDDSAYRNEIPRNIFHNTFYAGPRADNPGRELLDEITQAELLS